MSATNYNFIIMQKYLLVLAILFVVSAPCNAQQKGTRFITPFERSNGMQTATYFEVIQYYKDLQSFSTIHMETLDTTDAGYPLHVVYYNKEGKFNKLNISLKDNNITILINNGIHPGEPDGIDACMMLLRDAAEGKIDVPANITLAVIPVYNIGGALNRNSTTRANQNGPESYGFRGSAQNLDLNRDFIKCDALETTALEKLFHKLDPDVFIDNHVSDGADYQHIVTLLPTEHDKLGGIMGDYMYRVFTPVLFKDMKERGYDLVPYVNDFDKTPDVGWTEFMEPPRFSSGYAALFQTFAYVPETHMLKPFKDRVNATYALMESFIKVTSARASEIKDARRRQRIALINQKEFPLDWQTDTTQHDMVTLMGYESGYKTSEVSGLPRLYYDRNKPFTRLVPFYDHFMATKTVTAPTAYVMPQAWHAVADRMRNSGVEISQLPNDTTIYVTAYYIANYETVPKPYEKHYLHKSVQVTTTRDSIKFLRGSFMIATEQPAKRYIVETLEPTAPDAFFAWNFFDGILQEKEYYSDYVFEDMAADLLKKDLALKAMLDDKRKQDPDFAKSASAQLDFVYRHSKYLEPGYMRYPVFRIE